MPGTALNAGDREGRLGPCPRGGQGNQTGRAAGGGCHGTGGGKARFRWGEERGQEKTLPGKGHLKHFSRVPGGRRAALGEPEKARTEETPHPGEEPGSHRQGNSAGKECYF